MEIKNAGLVILLLATIIVNNIYAQSTTDMEIDFGIFLNGTEELYRNAIEERQDYLTVVEKEFTHPISGNKIYYTGPMEKSIGQYWLNTNGHKQIIVETHFRYGPMVKWYGEYIVELIASSANIPASYYFNFESNTLSTHYSWSLHIDTDFNNIIIIESGCLSMYNIKTNEKIKDFEFEKIQVDKYFDEQLNEELFAYRHPTDNELAVNGKYKIYKPNKETLIIEYHIKGTAGYNGDYAYELEGSFVYGY
jgi:hypothetical protein